MSTTTCYECRRPIYELQEILDRLLGTPNDLTDHFVSVAETVLLAEMFVPWKGKDFHGKCFATYLRANFKVQFPQNTGVLRIESAR